jgi:diaminopimelate decarboxylase
LPAAYGEMVRRVFANLGCALAFEPGRVIVGNAGILIAGVTLMKEGTTRRFAVVDAGMNDLVRPAMYDAHHDVMTVKEAHGELQPADVVGPVCETSDRFAQGVPLPNLSTGDLIAFMTAGAYGASMSSTYNARPLVPEVLVNGDQFAVVRRRPTYAEMTTLEQPAPWQS